MMILNFDIKDLKTISNDELHSRLERLAEQERRNTVLTVQHLKEADRRRLWAERGFKDLREYCVKALKYSDNQSYRYMAAIRLVREIPEVETKILEGTLNLTTVGQAQTFFRVESKSENRPITVEEKKTVLAQIDGKTEWQVKAELAKISPKAAIPDRVRPLSEDKVHLQVTLDQELMKKLDRLKECLYHATGGSTGYNDLLHKVCDIALKKIDPLQKPVRAQKKSSDSVTLGRSPEGQVKSSAAESTQTTLGRTDLPQTSLLETSAQDGGALIVSPAKKLKGQGQMLFQTEISSGRLNSASVAPRQSREKSVPTTVARPSAAPLESTSISGLQGEPVVYDHLVSGTLKKSRFKRTPSYRRPYISVRTRRALFERDQARCTYVDPKSGRRCECRAGLEIDHVRPLAKGGSTDIWNLRLLCRAHNQFAAIQEFGREKMQAYLRLD